MAACSFFKIFFCPSVVVFFIVKRAKTLDLMCIKNDAYTDMISPNPLWISPTTSVIECVRSCKGQMPCVSISFNVMTKMCHGFNIDFRQSQPVGTPETGWIHFDGIAVIEPCEDGWELFDGKCYKFDNRYTTWTTAKTECELYGGNLLMIRNSDENNWIMQKVTETGLNRPWLGGNDLDLDNIWKWNDGSSLTFSAWSPMNPSGDGKCMNIQLTLEWNDIPCTSSYNFICEKTAR